MISKSNNNAWNIKKVLLIKSQFARYKEKGLLYKNLKAIFNINTTRTLA